MTKEYGSAIRIATVLTDAPLECGGPIENSRCGSCRVCKDHCPAGAIEVTVWKAGVDREDMLLTEVGVTVIQKRIKERTGIEGTLRGKYFAGCPYTKSYLKRTARIPEY